MSTKTENLFKNCTSINRVPSFHLSDTTLVDAMIDDLMTFKPKKRKSFFCLISRVFK